MGTKGGGFEWDVCRALSSWLTNGKDDGQLVRSRSSGAWATQRQKRGKSAKSQLGDIAAAGPDVHRNVSEFLFHWFVECKAYKDEPNWWALWRCGGPDCQAALIKWWIKASEQAAACYPPRNPMLIIRRNFYPTLVVTENGFEHCSSGGMPSLRMRIDWCDYSLVVYRFEDMLEIPVGDFIGYGHI